MTKVLVFDSIRDIESFADQQQLTIDWDNSRFLDGEETFYFTLVVRTEQW